MKALKPPPSALLSHGEQWEDISRLQHEIELLVSKATSYELEIKKLREENAIYKQSLSELDQRLSKVSSIVKVKKEETLIGLNVAQKMAKLSEKISFLKTRSDQDKRKIRKLEKSEYIQHLKEEELKRLTGDSFEIDNAPMWWIKIDGEESGAYSFEHMRLLLSDNKN